MTKGVVFDLPVFAGTKNINLLGHDHDPTTLGTVSLAQVVNETLKRIKFALVDKLKLLNEENEVLEARVEVCLCSKMGDFVEMGMIYVSVDSKHAFEDILDNLIIILWKWDTCTNVVRSKCVADVRLT